MMTRTKSALAILPFLTFCVLMALPVHAQEVSRITNEKLKSELNSPDLILLDIRVERDWESSQWKIAGTLREDPAKTDEWKNKYPRDKTIVLYCA